MSTPCNCNWQSSKCEYMQCLLRSEIGTEPGDARKAQFEHQKITEESKTSIDNLADQIATNLTSQDDMKQEIKSAHDAQRQFLANLGSMVGSSSRTLVAAAPQLAEIRNHLQE
jgi:hypothetical protein